LSEQGERALAEHKYREAEQAYEKLRQLAPDTGEVYGRLGLIYFQEEKFAEAVPVLRRALKLKPDLPNTDLLLAMCLSELGEYRQALPGLEKGFRRATDLPLKRLSGLQLLRAYTGLEMDNNAVETGLELNRLFPEDAEVLYHTSKIYANFAYLKLQTLAKVAPSSIWRLQAAAEADESRGAFDQAIKEYQQVLAMDPDRHGVHYRIGRALLARSRTDDALKEFQKELELDPTNANAAYESGEIYRRAGQLDRAKECFSAALKYYSNFEEAQVGLAGVEIAMGRPEQAVPHLEKAAVLDPHDDVPYYRLSQAYKLMGKNAEQEKALAEFRRLRAERTNAQQDRQFSRASDVTRQEVDAGSPQ
jgi:tetratricopeptide (TPR) repeat protein